MSLAPGSTSAAASTAKPPSQLHRTPHPAAAQETLTRRARGTRVAAASVLVGFADALAAPEAVASLLGAGHRVTAFARRGRPVALRRLREVAIVEVTAPEHDLAACAEEVAALAAAHELTMPLDDPAVLVADRGLPAEAPVAGPRGVQARMALDKRVQLRAAQAAGFAVAPWVELTSDGAGVAAVNGHRPTPGAGEPHALELPTGWEFPAVLKPALAAEEHEGRLRRLAPRPVATEAEAQALLRTWGAATPALVQRWVAGTGAGIFGIADDEGIHHLSAHRRVRMMNPAGSGSSACASAPVPTELVGPVQRLLGEAGWRGMFMVELLRAGEEWWFMELNGRPWGSLALARRVGYEYPAWAAARALDHAAPLPPSPPFEELTCRHVGRELMHMLFVLRGPRGHVGEWPGRRATLRAMLASGSPTAWYNLQPGTRGLFLEDTWRTVATQTWGRRGA
ncbi:MAG TPA: hypothetical protein VG147_13165 [Solirubrobacteraceae bacterium]|nr:hypothetical protein [Solirubrobacteraceae bacterium]